MILAVVIGVLIFVLVFAIAAVTIGRETHRLDSDAPAPSFELIDAVDWISERLPSSVSGQISYADVRDIVTWHLDLMARSGMAQKSEELLIVDDESAVDAVILRAAEEGRAFDPTHIRAVLDGELGYLEAIGAVGPLADPEKEL